MANNSSLSFHTAKDSSLSKADDKSSCICSDGGNESFKTAIGSPMGNISVPPFEKSRLPFGVLLTKLQRKMVRRDAPKGEDLDKIFKVLGTIEGQDISVQEFMGLVSPYTADNGAILRAVFNEDVTSFKKMAKKVFETITQDNSDVLLNQQLTVGEYYTEKARMLQKTMLFGIQDIYDLAPSFDFERYYKEKDRYLVELFPLPEGMDETEELQGMKRQAAYHHLQWLRTEGERLNAENEALKERLNEVKVNAQDENCKALDKEEQAEAERLDLEQMEAEKRMELEELNNSIESSIVRKEQSMRRKADESVHNPSLAGPSGLGAAHHAAAKSRRRQREWKEDTARFIDSSSIAGHTADTKSRVAQP